MFIGEFDAHNLNVDVDLIKPIYLLAIRLTHCQTSVDVAVMSAAVGELETCKLQHLATIEDLHKQLFAVKQRSAELEQNSRTYEADHRLKSSEQRVRLQSLQNVQC